MLVTDLAKKTPPKQFEVEIFIKEKLIVKGHGYVACDLISLYSHGDIHLLKYCCLAMDRVSSEMEVSQFLKQLEPMWWYDDSVHPGCFV